MAFRRRFQQKKAEQQIQKKIDKVEEKLEKKESAKGGDNEFGLFYLFAMKSTVVLRHSFEGNIRAKPLNTTLVDHNGGFGEYAQWTAEPEAGGKQARFKNNKTGKYLRIIGNKIDIDGGQGPFTLFHIRKLSAGHVKLESVKEPGKFIAVTKDEVKVGNGGPFCRLTVLRKGKSEPYCKPYRFVLKQPCVLETRFGGHLRVSGKNSTELDGTGGKGPLALFEIIPSNGGKECKLLSKANGKYIRIQHFPLRKKWDINCGGLGGNACEFYVKPADAANYVRFESKAHKGKYIGIGLNGKNCIIAEEGKISNRIDLFTVYHD